MLKPICVKCQRFFRLVKVGYEFTEMMPRMGSAPPGNEAPDQWRPYKIWSGDLWRCNGCGTEIISGTGQQPISEHYKEDFGRWQELSKLEVNDC